ncbi:MAG: DEAD/DEAH box helicase family protein [Bacteroidetes bacterium]|nr:DEAD/DEAH box helicase family protein [Bacteroidota bacterium]
MKSKVLEKLKLSEQLNVPKEVLGLVGKYITSEDHTCRNSDRIRQLLTDDNKYNLIVAPTGSGKTSNLIGIAKEMGLEYVSVSPLIALAEQTAQNIEIPGISKEEANRLGMTLGEYIEEYSSQCTAVFDKLKIIIDNSEAGNKILIVDEAHHLVTSSGFRSKSLRFLEESLPKFRKVIFLTGTPEVLYLHPLIRGAKILKFGDIVNSPAAKYNYKIIPYQKAGMRKMLRHMMDNETNGKNIVFINNLKHLLLVKEFLIEAGVPTEHIFVAHSGSKKSGYFRYLVEHEMIHPDIRYFLTTSVISDGVNINNDDIENFYLFDTMDLTLLRQIIKRPRKQVGYIYDFVSGTVKGTIPNIIDCHGKKRLSITSILDFAKQIKRNNPYTLDYLMTECKMPGLYFNNWNDPVLYESEIIRMVFEEFHDSTSNDPTIRRELLIDLEGWSEENIVIERNELIVNESITNLQRKINNDIMEDMKLMADMLFDPEYNRYIKLALSYGDSYTRGILNMGKEDEIDKEAYDFFTAEFNDLSVKLFKKRLKFLEDLNFSDRAVKSILKLQEKEFSLFMDRVIYGGLLYIILSARYIIETSGFDTRLDNIKKELLYIYNKLERLNFEIENVDSFNNQLKLFCRENGFKSVFGSRKSLQKVLELKRKKRQIDGSSHNYYEVSLVCFPEITLRTIETEPGDEQMLLRKYEAYYSEFLSQVKVSGGHSKAA